MAITTMAGLLVILAVWTALATHEQVRAPSPARQGVVVTLALAVAVLFTFFLSARWQETIIAQAVQQRLLAGLLRQFTSGKSPPIVDTELWVEMPDAAGMDEDAHRR